MMVKTYRMPMVFNDKKDANERAKELRKQYGKAKVYNFGSNKSRSDYVISTSAGVLLEDGSIGPLVSSHG